MAKPARKKVIVPWDMETGGVLPERKYLFKLLELDVGESQAGDTQYIAKCVVLAPKKFKGQKTTFYFTVPYGLREFRQLCECLLGKSMPKAARALDLSSLEGKNFSAEIVHTTSKDGKRVFQNLTNFDPPQGRDDEDDIDEDDVDEVEDEDEDIDEDDDFGEDDFDEELADDDFDDEDEEDDDEDEEEEELPPRRSRRRSRR